MTAIQAAPANNAVSTVGNFFFRYRNALFPVVFLVVALVVRPAYFLGDETLDLIATSLGAVVAVTGGLVRILTIGLVYIVRGGRDRKVYAEDLVTDGIYAHVRNPMYLGNLLIAGGMCLVYGSAWLYAVVFPVFLAVYLSIVAAEEQFLSAKFGEGFDAYCRDVPRFFPNLRGVSKTIGSYQFKWKAVVRGEYGTTCSLLAGLYALCLWKYAYLHGSSIGEVFGPVDVIPLLIVLGLYGTARFLKKTKRI